MIEVRCSGTRKGRQDQPCARLTWVLSDDFVGSIWMPCSRCDTTIRYPETAPLDGPRILCGCHKWLANGVIEAGFAQMVCRRDRMIVRVFGDGTYRPPRPALVEVPQSVLPPQMRAVMPKSTEDVVSLITERWELLRIDRAHRSVDLAIGVRFDIFSRDGFRCVYCGRGPGQGVMLEADHVLARSLGGQDILENLVTACWDCNRGKSAKRIDTALLPA